MKFSFKSFAIGFACAALSLGAVTYANAAGDKTLKACANKTTGMMRYISKGSCKKTETSLSWNQMGPQGLPGSSGTAGAKGDTGAAGTNGTAGTSGTNGKTLVAVDVTGKEIGNVLGDGSAGGTISPDFLILNNNRLWRINSTEYMVGGSGYSTNAYSDAACTLPLGVIWTISSLSVQLTFGRTEGTDGGKTYAATTKYADGIDMTKPVYRDRGSSSCTALTTLERSDEYSSRIFYSLAEIPAPTYVAPLLIVLK